MYSAAEATRLHKGTPRRINSASSCHVEMEYGRLLPPTLLVYVGSGAEATPRSGKADVDYQARLLGSAEATAAPLHATR